LTVASLGLDFGTESVRALLVDLGGRELASAVARYRHGQITETLPSSGERLPPEFALQHPGDWLESAAEAVQSALAVSGVAASDVVGIGVDFTSCTMLPARRDGTPMCLLPQFAAEKFAWPKLWKHHGAQRQTDRINRLARERHEPWLWRYGGAIGLEWFFPKVLETLEAAPHVFDAADTWLEAGDWLVWQLIGGDVGNLVRSTCQAGYKACWNATDGYPSREFLAALDSRLEDFVAERLSGRLAAPGTPAGNLCRQAAERLALAAGTPVSAAIIDAHAGVPGAGAAEAGTLVMVLGTSSCHMLNAEDERRIPGIAGIVKDGILPGYIGYETGQAAVGDLFDWFRRLAGEATFATLDERAAAIGPGADGVICLDWMNGCRTPLMDGGLRGSFAGLSLYHTPAHLYRAALEGTAFGLRWIVELLREHDVPIRQFVATGGLPHHNPLLMQVYADVLGAPIRIAASKHGPALGAAILGALAARERTGFASAAEAIRAMAPAPPSDPQRVVSPSAEAHAAYQSPYREYRRLAELPLTR
jgi:L-ribulokinase